MMWLSLVLMVEIVVKSKWRLMFRNFINCSIIKFCFQPLFVKMILGSCRILTKSISGFLFGLLKFSSHFSGKLTHKSTPSKFILPELCRSFMSAFRAIRNLLTKINCFFMLFSFFKNSFILK